MSNERTVLADNDDLRRILVLLSQTVTYGAWAAVVTLGLAWLVLVALPEVPVPLIVPVLTGAVAAFATAASINHEVICQTGRAYRTTRPRPPHELQDGL